MTVGGLPVGTIVFTVIVTAAILAVMLDTYAEAVMAATLALVVGQLVVLFGPTLWLAIGLLTLAIIGRVTALVLGVPIRDGSDSRTWRAILDAVRRAWDCNERRDDRDPP